MALLTTADYAEIRSAIDTSLDEAALPGVIIGQDLYLGAAQREILARDPEAESRTGDALARVRLAALLWCASLLAPALPQIAGETHGNDSYTRKLADPEQVAGDLRARAEAELAAVLSPGQSTPYRPTFFRTAAGRRGR